MVIKSEVTKTTYEDNDCVFFKNPLQSAYYVAHCAELKDIFVTSDMKFTYVFSKEDHERLKMDWRNSSVGRNKVSND